MKPTVEPTVERLMEPPVESARDDSSTVLEEGTILEVATLLREAAGYTKIGLFDGAADALHQARVLDPNHEEVFEKLRIAYLKVGAVDDAVALIVDHAERLVASVPERATGLLDEAQELNPDHPAVFRARMGPLDPHDLDSGAEGFGTGSASTRCVTAEPRWANEGSNMKLSSDITAVTAKRPLPPNVTVKINVDDLERTLHQEQRMRESEGGRAQGQGGVKDAPAGVFGQSTELSAQPSRPSAFRDLTTAEIDLMELREVLGMDAETNDQSASAPVQGDARREFKPETTSPNALVRSVRWRHLATHHDGD